MDTNTQTMGKKKDKSTIYMGLKHLKMDTHLQDGCTICTWHGPSVGLVVVRPGPVRRVPAVFRTAG